jgi:hypothetical protein
MFEEVSLGGLTGLNNAFDNLGINHNDKKTQHLEETKS